MKIAIQGHPTRGKEVIQILEQLGGLNRTSYNGRNSNAYYYIDKNGRITYDYKESLNEQYKIYFLEEFEIKFPFKIGDKVITLKGLVGTIINFRPEDIHPYYVEISGFCAWCSTNTLKLYKDMETRNITLTFDKAREWYKKGGELKEIALQAFTKKELDPQLPNSWYEYCQMYQIPNISIDQNIPYKYIVLWKLEQLRDCYRQGWKPDWTNDRIGKYCITMSSNKPCICPRAIAVKFLAFQSMEVAEKFLKNFEPFIKEAGDFI